MGFMLARLRREGRIAPDADDGAESAGEPTARPKSPPPPPKTATELAKERSKHARLAVAQVREAQEVAYTTARLAEKRAAYVAATRAGIAFAEEEWQRQQQQQQDGSGAEHEEGEQMEEEDYELTTPAASPSTPSRRKGGGGGSSGGGGGRRRDAAVQADRPLVSHATALDLYGGRPDLKAAHGLRQPSGSGSGSGVPPPSAPSSPTASHAPSAATAPMDRRARAEVGCEARLLWVGPTVVRPPMTRAMAEAEAWTAVDAYRGERELEALLERTRAQVVEGDPAPRTP